jgi:hypothetical protein
MSLELAHSGRRSGDGGCPLSALKRTLGSQCGSHRSSRKRSRRGNARGRPWIVSGEQSGCSRRSGRPPRSLHFLSILGGRRPSTDSAPRKAIHRLPTIDGFPIGGTRAGTSGCTVWVALANRLDVVPSLSARASMSPLPCGAPAEMPVTARLLISFKDEIARIRAEFAAVEPEVGKLQPDDQDHLARWVDDSRAEKLWKKIQNLAWGQIRSYDPLQAFVVFVLAARYMAEMIPRSDRILERHERRIARHLERARRLEELATDWRDVSKSNHPMAALALSRAKRHEEEAQHWRKLAAKPPPRPPFHISRVDRAGSRQQRAFMQLVGTHLIELCGKALDSEVGVLNDIAFDTQKPTSAFQARSARRSTTRIGRSKQNRRATRRILRRRKS